MALVAVGGRGHPYEASCVGRRSELCVLPFPSFKVTFLFKVQTLFGVQVPTRKPRIRRQENRQEKPTMPPTRKTDIIPQLVLGFKARFRLGQSYANASIFNTGL